MELLRDANVAFGLADSYPEVLDPGGQGIVEPLGVGVCGGGIGGGGVVVAVGAGEDFEPLCSAGAVGEVEFLAREVGHFLGDSAQRLGQLVDRVGVHRQLQEELDELV